MGTGAEGKGWCLMTHPAGDWRANDKCGGAGGCEAQDIAMTCCSVITGGRGGTSKSLVEQACVEERGRYEAKRVYSTCGGRDGSGCIARLRGARGETRVARFPWNDARGKAGGAACSAAKVFG